MPFLLAEILNFQGLTHHIGVGSFSDLVTNSPKIISMNIPSDIGQKAVYKRMDRLKEKIKKIF